MHKINKIITYVLIYLFHHVRIAKTPPALHYCNHTLISDMAVCTSN